ncbi:MAG: rhomboid family intramembrane serine protease [FCB group bacterium]|nr:rhomboid family intramembrane serine protease [FCB group bacterium]
MFIPYKDDNPRILIPYVTWTLLGLNIFIFLFQLTLSQSALEVFIYRFGAIPAVITGRVQYQDMYAISPLLTLLTSMFIHGGWMHLAGNMLFLYVFADNVEGILGHRKFILFYMAGGVLAGLSHILSDPTSTVPMIGASGAISAVMAGYILKYPAARIHVLVFIFPMVLPAVAVIGFWFASQIMEGMANLDHMGGGVAWFAHIGGFIAGSVIMSLISKGKFYWLKR